MMRTSVFIQNLTDCREVALSGGKATNLGRLLRAGFPVPDGFVVTTRAFRYAQAGASGAIPTELPSDVVEEVRAAYRDMGGGTVAVRSSATAEDMSHASMAGQYETFLDIQGEDDLLNAIRRCWASLDAPRTRAYLQEHGIELSRIAMAVVVQRLVAADVAGVLFTESPHDGGAREMLLEASWGLGESIVSGRVQPDVLRLEQQSDRVIAATIADKRVYIAPGVHAERPVEESRRRLPCLSGKDVYRLWQLGKRTAEYFGSPQDIEWAIENGEVYMLQARPITTRKEAEAYEQVLHDTREQLRRDVDSGHGPWVLHNLAETLPHPTPLTWSIVRRFMSGVGGFGVMYRQAGFKPSKRVCQGGFLQQIGGRIYMDASLAPEMFFEDFPFAYDVDVLKKDPEASQNPPTLPRGSAMARLAASRKLAAVQTRLWELSTDLDVHVRRDIFAEIEGYVARNKPIDLGSLDAEGLMNLWQQHEKFVLDAFGPQTLMPSLICGLAMGNLKAFLREHFWDENPDALAQQLSAGGAPSRTVVADAHLFEVAHESRTVEQWIADHGHRATNELDLASQRWREQPQRIREMASRMDGIDPLQRHHQTVEQVNQQVQQLKARLSPSARQELDGHIELLRRYVAFREDGKDYLMLGYDLLRDLALEAGRRLEIGEDAVYLTREELFDALRVGFAPHHLIEKRKEQHRAEKRLSLPRVIDAAAIDRIGEAPPARVDQDGYKAFAVSAGQASGIARIVHNPTEAPDLGSGYILVCPSTDPSWTPLFINAAGLILECGGALSHGAVVAREMGLPAVVLPDATRLLRDGEQIHVDAKLGWVGNGTRSEDQIRSTSEEVDPQSTEIPRSMIPPPPSAKDRRAARLRNICASGWVLFIVAFFALPPKYVQQPTLSLMDYFLWPVVRGLGKPMTVVVIAGIVALVTLLVQKMVTDNTRLVEAKRRAASLRKQAWSLPNDSPRRKVMVNHANSVQSRTLAAAIAPVGILLGPLVLPFAWLQQRVDPSAWNAPAGSAVQIVATVDSSWSQPVRIDLPSSVTLDASTAAWRTLPPLRATLERLLALYRAPRKADPNEPRELQIAPDFSRQQAIDDLQAYLDAGIPPQGITWLVRPPVDFSGTFPVTVIAQGHAPITINVAVGEKNPPAPSSIIAQADAPVKSVRVVYSKPKQATVFFQPVASIDIGWVWLYILAYLPILLALRAFLKVA